MPLLAHAEFDDGRPADATRARTLTPSPLTLALCKVLRLECVDNAKADLIMQKPVQACESMDKLLLYAQFASFDDHALATQAGPKKNDLASTYASFCDSRGPEVEAKAVAVRNRHNVDRKSVV